MLDDVSVDIRAGGELDICMVLVAHFRCALMHVPCASRRASMCFRLRRCQMSITEGGQVTTRVMIAIIDSLDKDVMVCEWCSDK